MVKSIQLTKNFPLSACSECSIVDCREMVIKHNYFPISCENITPIDETTFASRNVNKIIESINTLKENKVSEHIKDG